jgi:hypothetical protein
VRTRRPKEEAAALKSAREVLRRHRSKLTAIAGVLGVEVTRKVTKGALTPMIGITVLVRRKRPLGKLSRSDRLPKVLDGIPIDVQPARFGASQGTDLGRCLRRERSSLVGGVGIAGNAATGSCTLTAACRAAGGQLVGLTTGHGLTEGDAVTQPSGGSAAEVVGQVAQCVLDELMDAAVILLDGNRRRVLGGVAGVDGPYQIGSIASDGDPVPVLMVGASSGWRCGLARRIRGPVEVEHPNQLLRMTDQILVRPASPFTSFNQPGDSGALLLSADGRQALGMVIAAMTEEESGIGVGLATPIDRILRRFRVDLLRPTAGLVGAGST